VSDDQQVFTAFHFGLVPNFGDDFGRAKKNQIFTRAPATGARLGLAIGD
jgi:hypothetical protein